MKNPRMSKKDLGVIKGYLRRAFSRSELHKIVLDRTSIIHSDSLRPRVSRWSKCELCSTITPTYKIDIDHIVPVIPIDSHFEDMTLDEVADRLWCELENLQGLCETCHDEKSAKEREARKPYKKEKRKK